VNLSTQLGFLWKMAVICTSARQHYDSSFMRRLRCD